MTWKHPAGLHLGSSPDIKRTQKGREECRVPRHRLFAKKTLPCELMSYSKTIQKQASQALNN